MLDILLVNGRYPDFRAGEMKSGNIGIKDGKIDIITEGEPKAAQVIDVSGRVVSPGFIDIHMHEEDFAGEGLNYCIADMMLRMGVTTAVGGNCGIQHQTLKEFKSGIQKLGGSPVNYQMLAGYNQCRYRLGTERYAAATQEERKRIREMLAAELEEGAIGISFGIEYDPGMTTDEILYAAKVTENPGHLIAAHYRSDNDKALDAIGEMIQVTASFFGSKAGRFYYVLTTEACRTPPPRALLLKFPAHGVHLKEKKKPRKRAQNTALCGI